MINSKKLSVIIPCKNEEKALDLLLSKMPGYIDEVIVVDNNSTDGTVNIAKKSGAKVLIEKRQIDGVGYGYAHQTGLKAATGDYIIALDGDDTYPIGSIRSIILHMERNGLDFISCSRLPLKNRRAISRIRQLGIQILNHEAAILFGYQFKDILTGMWVLKGDAAKKLSLKNGGWDYSPEIKIAALTNRDIKFGEYHIRHFVRYNGTSKLNIWKTGFQHFKFIFECFRSGKYRSDKLHLDIFPKHVFYFVKSIITLMFVITFSAISGFHK